MNGRSIKDLWSQLTSSVRDLLNTQGDDLIQLERLAEEIRNRPDPFTMTTDADGERRLHVKPELIDVTRVLKP